MRRIGVVGLGQMGAPMARNLLRAGYEVAVWSRSVQALKQLESEGALAAADLASLVGHVEAVLTVLPDGDTVSSVILGPGGVLEHAAVGLFIIDASTIEPAVAQRIAAEASARGVRALDAPVSGGTAAAEDGTLSVMVGGEVEDFAAVRSLLGCLGRTVLHVGGAGSGQIVRAANQLLVAGTIGLVSEALALLEAAGVDPATAVPVLTDGLAGNAILDRRADSMIERDFEPRFRMESQRKDLGIVLELAATKEVALPITGPAAQLVNSACGQGHRADDHTALMAVIESLSARRAPRAEAIAKPTRGEVAPW